MRRRACAFLAALAALASLASTQHNSVCDLNFCKCYPGGHPTWTIVNCTVPADQKLDILDGDLPDTTTKLIVEGGEAVMLGANALSNLQDARLIRISRTRVILFRRSAAVNLSVVNIYLEIDNCDVLRFEERTFSGLRGPLSAKIRDCEYVSVEGEAFSWVLSISIVDVKNLQVNSAAFMLDPTAANVGLHGPGMMIELKNLTAPEFPGLTFGSSAAEVRMENINVRAIRPAAFPANTYNAVVAINCSFHLIESDAFTHKSFIDNLIFHGCKIHQFESKALQSAATNMNFTKSRIDKVGEGAINGTLASVTIQDCEFHKMEERSMDLSSSNKLIMERNKFDVLPADAIVAPNTKLHEFIFNENEIEIAEPQSLNFIGQAYRFSEYNLVYKNNYFGQTCHCNLTKWFSTVINHDFTESFIENSFCTVDEFFARCFNEPEQNMKFKKFLNGVCDQESTIKCEPSKAKAEGTSTEIKNPRFPHKGLEEDGLSERDKKIIGIVIVSAILCVIIVLCFSLVKWMRRKGYCVNLKDLIISSNSSCALLCDRMCTCGRNSGLDNARSISRLSVHEYTERHRLNEPRVQDVIQETIPEMYTEQIVPSEDKTTQTLPEELTKELLQNLKEKLEDPENYAEAREMIEHLYELIKVEETCNENPHVNQAEENIYELPFQNTAPRIGKNKKKMISIGTRTPSLDKLLPLSPYNRQTALAHEYFEPRDFAVHLYAEIANSDKERKNLLGAIPDVVTEQIAPRGPYLRAMRDKCTSPMSPALKPQNAAMHGTNSAVSNPQNMSTIKSNKSTTSNSSGKMLNRPLPEKPLVEHGPGPSSSQLG